MKTDGIIFDLDGTLWDATDAICDSWIERLKQLGIPVTFTKDDLQACMGLPMTSFFEHIFPEMDTTERDRLREDVLNYENYYMEQHGGNLYEDLEETLRVLKQKYPLMIVSNCQDGYIQAFLAAHNLESYFSDIESFGHTGRLKADNIRMVVERNNLQNPVYVGDIQADSDASHEAGVPIVYAAYGFGEINDAEAQIEQFNELLELFE